MRVKTIEIKKPFKSDKKIMDLSAQEVREIDTELTTNLEKKLKKMNKETETVFMQSKILA